MSNEPVAEKKVKSRAAMRQQIFASKDRKYRIFEFFGEEIELRQPLFGDILSAQDNPDREAAVIETLVKYAYIPGTDEKLFEEGDADSFKQLPFGADFMRVNNALEELTEVNFQGKKNG